MKQLFILIFAVGASLNVLGQTVTISYDELLHHQNLTTLSAGNTLVVTPITAAQHATLTLTSGGGDDFAGSYAGQTLTYILGGTFKSITVETSTGNSYDIDLIAHTVGNFHSSQSSPVGSTGPPAGQQQQQAFTFASGDVTNIAFWDAITLYQYILATNGAPTDNKMALILSQYVQKTRYQDATIYNSQYTYALLKAKNPFLGTGFDPVASHAAAGNLQSITGVLGGLDVTNYVQAFADFLRDRIKQELTIAYLQKFKDALAKNVAIRELLPKTWQTFKDNDVFNLPSMGATYKQAFADDLAKLPVNFQNYVYQYQFTNLPTGNKELFIMGSAMYNFIDQTAQGFHPSTTLHSVAQRYPYQTTLLTSTYIIAVLDMFSQNLKSKSGDSWIDLVKVQQINPDIIRLFFALLYEQHPDLFEDTKLSKKLVSLAEDTQLQQRFNNIYNFILFAQNIDQKIKDFKNLNITTTSTYADKKQAALDFFLSNSDAITNLVKYTFSVVDPKDVNDAKYTQIITSLGDAVDIAKAIHSNDFAKASNASISLITSVIGDSKDQEWVKTLKNMLAFANDMVAAKSSDEIKAVIENYAAPVQSYQMIRKSNFSVALSAYPGLYVGSEWSRQAGMPLFKYGTFGVTAPIGFAFSVGCSTKESSSATAFISMFDIGAALSYRFNNTSNDIPNKITLGQIFSPGLHMVWGIKNSPLAVKLGYQYAPQLREINTTATQVDNAGVWRLSAALCVDIPIYILVSKH
jgi:hypothetical protein